MNAPQLFNPQETQPQQCTHKTCQATQKHLCQFNIEYQDTRLAERPRRPRGCLAAHNPQTAAWPPGY